MNSAILFMLIAACTQALVSVTVKKISNSTPISIEIAFYYIIPVVWFLPTLLKNGFSLLKTKKFFFHFTRGVFSFSSVGCFFYAVKYIPLGLATTLFNMIPFFVPLIANFFLKEKITLKTYLGLCIALPGVLLLINPKFSTFSVFHFIIGISAAILMASSMVMLKYLVREKESVDQIVFHQYSSCSLIALVFIGLESVINASFPEAVASCMNISTLFLLFVLGGLSIGTQYCFSKAAQHLPVSQFAPFLYLSVPLSSILGFVFWNQSLSMITLIGSALIFAGLCICSLGMEKFLRRPHSS